jgi:hypothetical protein
MSAGHWALDRRDRRPGERSPAGLGFGVLGLSAVEVELRGAPLLPDGQMLPAVRTWDISRVRTGDVGGAIRPSCDFHAGLRPI